MAAPTNSTTTLNTVGAKEDLNAIIFRVVADKTPFISNIGRDKATNTYH